MSVMQAMSTTDRSRRGWHATGLVVAAVVCTVAYQLTMNLVLGVEVPVALGATVGLAIVAIVCAVDALLPHRRPPASASPTAVAHRPRPDPEPGEPQPGRREQVSTP